MVLLYYYKSISGRMIGDRSVARTAMKVGIKVLLGREYTD